MSFLFRGGGASICSCRILLLCSSTSTSFFFSSSYSRSLSGSMLAQVYSRESPDAAAGAPSGTFPFRSQLAFHSNIPTIKSEMELMTLSACSSSPSSIQPLVDLPGRSYVSSGSSASAYSTNRLIVLGLDITHLPRHKQYIFCACGVFFFTLIYGYFQELVVVRIFDRQLPLFLALCQFTGFAFNSLIVSLFVNRTGSFVQFKQLAQTVPYRSFLLMSALRAFDLGMTNSSMK